jgi:hypothetical protein
MKCLPGKKSVWVDGVTDDFYQSVKELTPLLLKWLHKIECQEMAPNSCYEFSTKLEKYMQEWKL